MRLEQIEPEKPIPLEDAAPHILRGMQEAVARPELAAWLEQLRAESYIEILDE